MLNTNPQEDTSSGDGDWEMISSGSDSTDTIMMMEDVDLVLASEDEASNGMERKEAGSDSESLAGEEDEPGQLVSVVINDSEPCQTNRSTDEDKIGSQGQAEEQESSSSDDSSDSHGREGWGDDDMPNLSTITDDQRREMAWNLVGGIVKGIGETTKNVTRVVKRLNEDHNLQDHARNAIRNVGDGICVLGEHTSTMGKKLKETAEDNDFDKKARDALKNTHNGIKKAAKKFQEFEEKHQIADAVATAALCFGAASISTGHVGRGAGAFGLAAAAHTLGVGLRMNRSSKDRAEESQIPY